MKAFDTVDPKIVWYTWCGACVISEMLSIKPILICIARSILEPVNKLQLWCSTRFSLRTATRSLIIRTMMLYMYQINLGLYLLTIQLFFYWSKNLESVETIVNNELHKISINKLSINIPQTNSLIFNTILILSVFIDSWLIWKSFSLKSFIFIV